MQDESIDSTELQEYERDRNNRRKAVSAEITYERLQVALIAAAKVDDQERRIDSKAQEEKIERLREKAYAELNKLACVYLSPDQINPEQSAPRFRAACDLFPRQLWVEHERFGLSHLSCKLFVKSIWHQLAISENGQTYSLGEFAEKKATEFEKDCAAPGEQQTLQPEMPLPRGRRRKYPPGLIERASKAKDTGTWGDVARVLFGKQYITDKDRKNAEGIIRHHRKKAARNTK